MIQPPAADPPPTDLLTPEQLVELQAEAKRIAIQIVAQGRGMSESEAHVIDRLRAARQQARNRDVSIAPNL